MTQQTCRHCTWTAPDRWANPDAATAGRAKHTALLLHKTRCEHRPQTSQPPARRHRTFGLGSEPPAGPYRWYLSWGLVTETDGDETGDYETAWDRWCVWIGRSGKPTINLWRGRRRPFRD